MGSVQAARRIVVKVGSALVTNDGHGLDHRAIARWAKQIAQLHAMGKEVILVSSGAIAEGMLRLGWTERPKHVYALQAAAAVGQMGLVQAYEEHFREHKIQTAQVLLTHQNLADREQYLNARATLRELLRLKVLTIINENDTVVTNEIKVGDNDTLGALVTNLVEADTLVILTDQRGLYTADPRKDPNATFVATARAGDPALEKMAGGAASTLSKGGMITKILAAKRAQRSGANTVIASGREEDVLVRLAQGESIGTELLAQSTVLQARKQWMADHLRTQGELVLDEGALHALLDSHTSLLPVGVTDVRGHFVRGELVSCVDKEGHVVAKGLVNYASEDALRLCRAHSHEIESILGYVHEPEMIHRDNLLVIER